MVWLKNRGSGILLHLSALPSCQGIGNLGSSSRRFLNFLSSVGSTYWQICPIGPTGFGNSPIPAYQPLPETPPFFGF